MSTLQWVGAGFVLVLIGFLFRAYSRPQTPGSGQTDIVRFICSMCGGFAGGLFVGDALFRLDSTVGAATKMALTGGAGFVFACIVWYGYGRTRRLPSGYSFSIPRGWTFQNATQAMVQQEGAVIDFVGFQPHELSAILRPAKVTTRNLSDALGTIGGLSQTAIRSYVVAHNAPRYVLTVKAQPLLPETLMKNVCPCPDPPGGEAKCPADQLAICRIVDGRIQTDCLTPPLSSLDSKQQLANWVLAAVTNEERSSYEPLSDADRKLIERALRREGQAQTVDALGARVSFRLSDEMIAALSSEDDIRGSSSSSPVTA